MKAKNIRTLLLSPLALLLIIGCSGENTSSDDNDNDDLQTNTSSFDDDNDNNNDDSDASGVHNQGLDCLTCHSPSSNSGEKIFNSGATVFNTLNGANKDANNASDNHKIRLRLSSGQTIDYTLGNGSGNSWVVTDTGAIDNFTVEIVNAQNVVVNSSLTNSHDVGQLACNSCHTSKGLNNAPGRIVSYKYTASLAQSVISSTNTTTTETTTTSTDTTPTVTLTSFATEVMPILNNCKSCHGSNGDFTVTDTAGTYANLSTNNFLDTATPANSDLLTKAINTSSHDGGQQFTNTSTEYTTILKWIEEGASNN